MYTSRTKKCRSERRVMSSIVCAFVSITALFSLGLCLLTAATFSKEEAILWMVEVVESLLMQACAALHLPRSMHKCRMMIN